MKTRGKQPVEQRVEAFFSAYPKRSYPTGQILVFANENPEYIFYLADGKVRKYDVSYRGDEVVVNIFKSGAFFPMSWAINRSPNHYFYKTETASSVHIVPTEAALQFIKNDPEVMFDLLSRIYRGMDGLLGRLVHLMSGSAKSRLLYELIIECRRFGEENPDGSYSLKINEGDLAARTGLSRETVSREIRKIKTDNLVKLDGKSIQISNLAGLEEKIGSVI